MCSTNKAANQPVDSNFEKCTCTRTLPPYAIWADEQVVGFALIDIDEDIQ
ncbi:hypothetical protein ACEE64_07585 [Streptococcus suis]